MVTVCVPSPDAAEALAGLPVDVVVWSGSGPRPTGLVASEFFVGNYQAHPVPDVLAGLDRVRVVQLLSAGYEHWLPLVPPGVTLCNGRGIHGGSTAELALGGLIAVLRELPRFLDLQRVGRWEQDQTDGLDGSAVLVLGAGDIGGRVAVAAQALGARVSTVAHRPRPGVHTVDELPRLLPEHAAVVLALPATARTAKLVDADFLAAMPDGAVLVNVSRGAIVDTDALLAELTAGRLRAFLDVTDPEPLPVEHPLWSAPNLILTPHIGGGTRGWEQRAFRLVREQLERYLAGEALVNVV